MNNNMVRHLRIPGFVAAITLFLLFIFRCYAGLVVIPWEFKTTSFTHHFIAHAGGGINEYTYTDSKEAVLNSIANGFTLIELDLNLSSDDAVVAVHDWAEFRNFSNIKPELGSKPMLESEYLNSKIYGKYSPVTKEFVDKIFSENRNLYLVTDKLNNYQKINSFFGYSDRVFVEVFGVINYTRAILAGIKRPMLSLGIGKFGPWIQYPKIFILNVKYVVVEKGALFEHKDFFRKIQSEGVKVFVYTINDDESIKEVINNFDATIYTDRQDLIK